MKYDVIQSFKDFSFPQKMILYFSSIPHKDTFAENADYGNYTGVLNTEFSLFCMKLDKPLVILFDEVDCLAERTLISFMRQLRNGYREKYNQTINNLKIIISCTFQE